MFVAEDPGLLVLGQLPEDLVRLPEHEVDQVSEHLLKGKLEFFMYFLGVLGEFF